MNEKQIRLMKTITWRVAAILTTFGIAILLGVPLVTSIALTVLANIVKSIIYYIHEWFYDLWKKKRSRTVV